MSRILPQLICLLLAAIIVFGGVISHAGSVLHITSSDSIAPSSAHGHPAAEAAYGAIELATTEQDGPAHALGFCVDTRCCVPAVHLAAQSVMQHMLEGGKLVIRGGSNYSLSVAYSLLRPPRAIA